MGVTIVSNELSEDEVRDIQKTADKLAEQHGLSVHAIMHQIGMKRKMSVSLYSSNGQVTMNCRKANI